MATPDSTGHHRRTCAIAVLGAMPSERARSERRRFYVTLGGPMVASDPTMMTLVRAIIDDDAA
jgi:hypothetical protein